ncbi:hypothetical protein [Streptodolium elevatio]
MLLYDDDARLRAELVAVTALGRRIAEDVARGMAADAARVRVKGAELAETHVTGPEAPGLPRRSLMPGPPDMRCATRFC